MLHACMMAFNSKSLNKFQMVNNHFESVIKQDA